MASSDTEICNMALSHVGVSQELTDLATDRTANARACRRFYEHARDEVLRDFPWPFATRVESLALVTDYTTETAETYAEYDYAWRYPANAVRLLRIRSGTGRWETNLSRVRHRIISDADGMLLLADMTPGWIEYVTSDVVVSRFAPDFVTALSLYLASLIAPRVTGGDPQNLGPKALVRYDFARKKAWANALNEQMGDDGRADEDYSGFMGARA